MHPKVIFLEKSKLILIYVLLIALFIGCNKEEESNIPAPTVSIRESDSGYQLIRNGKPFYIKGGAAHPSYLKELKDAGGNTARIYDTLNLKNTLDEAHELGLAIVVDIPLPSHNNSPEFYEKEELFLKIREGVKKIVN